MSCVNCYIVANKKARPQTLSSVTSLFSSYGPEPFIFQTFCLPLGRRERSEHVLTRDFLYLLDDFIVSALHLEEDGEADD